MAIGSELRHCSRAAVSMRSRLRSVALSKNIGPQYTNPPRDNASRRAKAPSPHQRGLQFVDFRRQHKIALGQPVDLMRPNRHLCLAPTEADIGVMPLLLR